MVHIKQLVHLIHHPTNSGDLQKTKSGKVFCHACTVTDTATSGSGKR